MVRYAFGAAISILLAFVPGVLSAPLPAPDNAVRSIIAKAIEAKGGAENIRKYKAAISKFRGILRIDDLEVNISGVGHELAPDGVALRATLNVNGTEFSFVQVCKGGKGWTATNGKVEDMTKEILEEMREDLHADEVSELRALVAKEVDVSAIGETTIGGKSAIGVRVSKKGFRDIKLYFDKTSGVLLSKQTRTKDVPTGKDVLSETLYSDYKNISGLMIPFKVTQTRDGKLYSTTETLEYTVAEKLPQNTFDKP